MRIEALAKAVYVLRDPNLVANGKWRLRGHDLVALVSGAGLPLDSMERSVLVQLTRYVKWAGRYPIPLYAADMMLLLRSKGPTGRRAIEAPAGTVIWTEDRHVVDRIAGRLEAVLDSAEEHK